MKTINKTIPKEWKKIRLGDLVKIKKGEQLNRLDMLDAGLYPALNGGIQPSGFTDKWNKETNTITISEGGNSCGYVNYNRQRFWCGGHCYALEDISDKVDKIFLYQTLKGRQEDIMKLRVGSGLPNIQKKAIENFEIILPSINDQKKIAEVLSGVDEEIEKVDEVIKKTEELKRGLMAELLTKGIGHSKFKKTKLGLIPEEWSIKELKDITEKIGDGLHGTPKYSDNANFSFINGNNLLDGKIKIYKETKLVSEEEYELYKKNLNQSTILLSINGTVGNIAFYNNEKVVLGKSVAYINCDNEVVKEFIAYQLQSDRTKIYFEKSLAGTTIKNLSLGAIRAILIPLPKIEEQKKIVEILTVVTKKIDTNKKIKNQLTELKKGLMQDLLSGTVRA